MANQSKIAGDMRKELLALIESAKKQIKKTDLDNVGEVAIKNMKDFISKGISSIEEFGRFPAYKRGNDPRGYPAKVKKKYPAKRNRPVNLKLSGKFQEDLDYKSNVGSLRVDVGYFDQLSEKKESGHREGVHGQPSRPTIPSEKENLNRSIVLKIEQVIQGILNRLK